MELFQLSDGRLLSRTRLPESLLADAEQFENLWDLHPEEYPTIRIHGRRVKTPRWQAVYGADYHFAGGDHRATEPPAEFEAYLDWGRREVEPRLNGIVVNWYDARLRHYIGPHRDATKGMIPGSPIVMISLGAARTLRLRRWRGAETRDFPAADGDVYILSYDANLAWTHEVPRFARDQGRRISITLRAFEESRGPRSSIRFLTG